MNCRSILNIALKASEDYKTIEIDYATRNFICNDKIRDFVLF